MAKIKVAAVQMAPRMGDKPGNLRRIFTLVQTAARAGAKLIVLPELATTGYSYMSTKAAAVDAEVIHPDGATMRAMAAICAHFKVTLVWGMVEQDADSEDLYNAQVLMTPEGTWESYRKINRWGNDFLWAKAGKDNPPIKTCTFEVDGAKVSKKVGLLICRDVRDKKDDEKGSFYDPGDADIVAFSANWGDGGFPANAWMDFVKDNKVALVVANRYGKEIPNDFGEGGSCIISPPETIDTEGLTWNADCIVYADA